MESVDENLQIGDWVRCKSRSTGKVYYFNKKSNESVWYDSSLPLNWAWGMVSDKGPKFYINLVSNIRQSEIPAASLDEEIVESSSKRPRIEKQMTGDISSTVQISTSTSPLEAVVGEIGAVVGAPRAKWPSNKMVKEPRMGFPVDRPFLPELLSSRDATLTSLVSPLSDAVKLILKQVLGEAKAKLKVRNHAKKKAAISQNLDTEFLTEQPMVIFDVGAGMGISTEFLLDECKASPNEVSTTEVYAIDLWDEAYWTGTLREFGHENVASALESLEVKDASGNILHSSISYESFCFFEHENSFSVTPVEMASTYAIEKLSYLEITPTLIYFDGDYHYKQVKDSLNKAIEKFPDAYIVGNSWDKSLGIRKAVQEVAIEKNKRIHVEQGIAWTFDVGLITESLNTQEENSKAITSAVDAKAAASLQVKNQDAETRQAQLVWLGKLFEVISNGGEASALQEAIGSHGRTWNEESKSWSEGDQCWIDIGDDDKRHMTPLMKAAKSGLFSVVRSLIDDYGANVNVRADRSLYTAILVAAYEGHDEIVKVLLARGADPMLPNKWGETAIQASEAKGRYETVEIMKQYIQDNRTN
jgi:Ankyrin repeats (3 copies)/WW domain